MPKISVIIPTYNDEQYIKETVESILNQSFTDIEVIVGDDCSTDNTYNILKSIKDDRLKCFTRNENKGQWYTLNECLSMATGEYIAVSDDDDVSYPRRLELQLAVMESNPGFSLVGAKADNIINDKIVRNHKDHPYVSTNHKRFSLIFDNNNLISSSFFMRASILRDNNIVYEDRVFAEDYAMEVNLARYGELYTIPQSLLAYRVHGDQVTQTMSVFKQREDIDPIIINAINDTQLSQTEKKALTKAVIGKMQTKNDYECFIGAFEKWSEMCGLGTRTEDIRCKKYIFNNVINRQKKGMELIKFLMLSGNSYFALNKRGVKLIAKCLLKYNRSWFDSPIEV